jgi:hypothetical protein
MNAKMTIEQMNEIFNNGTDEQRQNIVEMYANINVKNRNNDKTEKHAEKILNKKNEKRTN